MKSCSILFLAFLIVPEGIKGAESKGEVATFLVDACGKISEKFANLAITYSISSEISEEEMAYRKDFIPKAEQIIKDNPNAMTLDQLRYLKDQADAPRRVYMKAQLVKEGSKFFYREQSSIDLPTPREFKPSVEYYCDSKRLITLTPGRKQAIIDAPATEPPAALGSWSDYVFSVRNAQLGDVLRPYGSWKVEERGDRLIMFAEKNMESPIAKWVSTIEVEIEKGTWRVHRIEMNDLLGGKKYPSLRRSITYPNAESFVPSRVETKEYSFPSESEHHLFKTTCFEIENDPMPSPEVINNFRPALPQGFSVFDRLTGERFTTGDSFEIVDDIYKKVP